MDTRGIFEKRLSQAVKASATVVQSTAQENHGFTSKTGQLERAIDVRLISNRLAEVYIDNKVAPYGSFVHEGTKEHDIFPKTKKALRWVPVGGNGFAFAKKVHHKGTAADPFLYDALDHSQDRIRGIFSKAVGVALNDVAESVNVSASRNNLHFKL